jgi:drug/metabolite transporter (DMT)-like permease
MRTSRVDWLIFLALGLMWGSSYLFIKIAVDDFGTFTLVALRLLIGAALLWIVVKAARQPLPRSLRTYRHLVVMGFVNIALPFLLITWAERNVESSLAAILTSVVPLFVVVLAPLFIEDEPMRANGIAGVVIGFVGVVVLTGRGLGTVGSDILSELALLGASLSYAAGAVYARRNIRGLAPMIPAVFQVTFAMLMTAAVALATEHPWTLRPSAAGIGSIVWLGVLGSGLAYLAFFRLLSHWGATRTAAVAYLLPVVGIVLGFLVLGEDVGLRTVGGTGLIIGGVALVNSKLGGRVVLSRARPAVAESAGPD